MQRQDYRKQRLTLLILSLIFASAPLAARDHSVPTTLATPFQWQVGEDLLYKVKYSFLTVGTLHFQILKRDTLHGRPVYLCRMHMKSSGIPFINFDDVYESYIDEEVYSHRLESWEKQSDHILYTHYEMNYADRKIYMHMEKRFETDTVAILDSSVALTERVQDGLSLLFYARANVKKKQGEDVTVFSFNDYRKTFINFTGKLEEVKSKGKDVMGYYLDGKMKFVGIAGLKEDFKGWFSPEPQHVPLHAKMKVIVGSVRLNLEEWKNWPGDSILVKE